MDYVVRCSKNTNNLVELYGHSGDITRIAFLDKTCYMSCMSASTEDKESIGIPSNLRIFLGVQIAELVNVEIYNRTRIHSFMLCRN